MTKDQTSTVQNSAQTRTKTTIGGTIAFSDEIIATIAAVAARQAPEIVALRRSWLSIFDDSPSDGVTVEVGQHEVAVDLEVFITHGCDIREVARHVRQLVGEAIERMTNRKVVEVNLKVIGVEMPDQG